MCMYCIYILEYMLLVIYTHIYTCILYMHVIVDIYVCTYIYTYNTYM